MKVLNISSGYALAGSKTWAMPFARMALWPCRHAFSMQIQRTSLSRTLDAAGGVPGFSGTGYVDYPHRLGYMKKRIGDESHGNNDAAGCFQGLSLGMSGMAKHIYSCLQLVYYVTSVDFNLTRERELKGSRREGWNIYATGSLTARFEKIEKCVDYFAQDNSDMGNCYDIWVSICQGRCEFIACFLPAQRTNQSCVTIMKHAQRACMRSTLTPELPV